MPWQNCASVTDPNTGATIAVATLDCIPTIFQNVVDGALLFVGVVAVFMIVYAGIRYVTSRGDPKAVESAKQTLTWAVIGLLIVIFSFIIIALIASFTGAGQCITTFWFGACLPFP